MKIYDKINILQVNKLYYPVIGGIEQVVQQIAEGLQDKTNITVLVCQKKGKSMVENINGVRVIKAGSLGMAFSMPVSLSFPFIFRKLSKEADIIHIHMPFPLADIALLLSGYRGKVVLWWHSDIVKQKKLLRLYKPFLVRLLRRADLIITATEGHITGSEYLMEYRKKCKIIPYAISPYFEKKGTQYYLLSNNEKSADNKIPVSVLFVGRLVYYKGCEILLNAFSKVSGAILTIAGEGPLAQALKAQASALGIAERVRFTGKISNEELSAEYEQCDFLVLPSIAKSEAFGLVQIEAMSFGKPVINTNLPGGVPYVSINGQTGLTVDPNNEKTLAEAIQKLVNNKELRLQYGAAAYDRAHSAFSEKKMLASLLEAYNNLIKTGDVL